MELAVRVLHKAFGLDQLRLGPPPGRSIGPRVDRQY